EAVLAKNRGSEQYLLCFAHKGSLTYEIKAEGKAAHSSTPELGINAIDPLVQAYNDQEKYFKTLTAADPVLGKTVPVFTKITGGNQLNSVPAEASLFGKIRTIPAENNDDIAAKIGDIIAEINEESPARLSLNILGNKFPVASDPDSKVVRLLQKYGEQDLQQTIPTGGMKGGTDAAEYFRRNPKLAVAIFGPGNMTAHQVDEYLDLDNFKAFCQIYEQTAKDFFEE
ncbi:M20/M25/M40 family metallo-hydrolase, partial [Fructobacillus ficulneus]